MLTVSLILSLVEYVLLVIVSIVTMNGILVVVIGLLEMLKIKSELRIFVPYI